MFCRVYDPFNLLVPNLPIQRPTQKNIGKGERPREFPREAVAAVGDGIGLDRTGFGPGVLFPA